MSIAETSRTLGTAVKAGYWVTIKRPWKSRRPFQAVVPLASLTMERNIEERSLAGL